MKATRVGGFAIGWRHGLAAASSLVLFACGGGGSGPEDSANPMGGSTAGTGAGGAASGGVGNGSAGTDPAAGGAPISMPPGGATGVAPDVGSKAIHRLSNLEYDNTIRDLLGSSLQPALAFQPDAEALGFDNIADAADMNPRHVKDYYEAAEALVNDVMANPALKGSLVVCQPAAAGDPACAVQIIQSFGLRAFRRPLEQWELDHYGALYTAALAVPLSHDEAIGHVVRTMISAPQFLYRMEIDADPFAVAMRPLNGYEIASRLSYLLWSTMPDQVLFDAAASGALLQLDTLQAQVDRMLSDAKSSTLVSNFTWQWFGMNHLTSHAVDTVRYPAWSETMRASMQGEVQLFFDEFIHQGRPLTEMLTADVNYVDATLAPVYGVAAPTDPGFTRMEITTDERKGVVGLAGFLTHTSRHNRTAPTIRGAWVLNALLCQDIAPPTNIVIAPLPEVDPETMSVRELIEAHRDNGACSGCHAIVDPVGLGMEQYDAIGQFRTQYENGDPIDTAGNFPDGVTFTGFSDMVDKLGAMTKSETDPTLKTAECAAKKLFLYGLGRAVNPSEAYLEQLITNWEAGGSLTMANLVKQLVVNDVFRFRHGTPDAM